MSSRRLALGSMLQVANLVAAAVASLVLMPFVVQTVGDRAYGVWVVVGTFVGYYGLLDFGLTSTVARYLAAAAGAKDEAGLQETFSTALAMFTAIGLGVVALTAVLVALLHAPAGTDADVFRRVLALAGLAFAINFPSRAFAGLAHAFLRYDLSSMLELAGLVTRTATIVLLLRSGWSIDGLAIASLATAIGQLILWPIVLRRLRSGVTLFAWRVDGGRMRKLVDFSAFVFLVQLADVLRFRVDVLIIGRYVGLAAVTHYGIVTMLIGYFISAMASATSVLGGVFGRQAGADDLPALRRSFLAGTRLAVFVATFAGFGLIAWGRAFITRWMGPSYTDVYPSLVLLAAGCTVALWQTPSVSAMYGVGRQRVVAAATIVEGVLNLALSLILAPRYGMIGVALGTMVPMVAMKVLVQPVYVTRALQLSLRTYAAALGDAALRAIVACVPGAVLAAAVLEPTVPSLAGVSVASAGLYALVLWVWGLQDWERALLRRLAVRTPAAS